MGANHIPLGLLWEVLLRKRGKDSSLSALTEMCSQAHCRATVCASNVLKSSTLVQIEHQCATILIENTEFNGIREPYSRTIPRGNSITSAKPDCRPLIMLIPL